MGERGRERERVCESACGNWFKWKDHCATLRKDRRVKGNWEFEGNESDMK